MIFPEKTTGPDFLESRGAGAAGSPAAPVRRAGYFLATKRRAAEFMQ
jgi:hypothetical protein